MRKFVSLYVCWRKLESTVRNCGGGVAFFGVEVCLRAIRRPGEVCPRIVSVCVRLVYERFGNDT